MLATSATRPARLSDTMRRVRLENDSAKKNCPARRSQPSGRRQPRSRYRRQRDPVRGAPKRPRGSGWNRTAFDLAMAELPVDALVYRSYASTPSGRMCQSARPPLKRRSGFLEAIADAVQRLDHLEIVVDHLELLAQPLDVAVDGAVVDIDLIVIGGVHQRVAALHHARPRRQRLQDQKFRHRQRHRLVLPGAGVPLGIHPQQAAVERVGVRLLRHGGRILGLAAAQHGLDALDQQALRERLADEIVGAHLEAEQFVDLFILGGQEDHRQVGLLAQPAQRFHAVHARHLDVEDREVRRRGAEAVERRSAIRVGHDAIAFGFERDRDGSENVAVVIDQSDCGHEPAFE